MTFGAVAGLSQTRSCFFSELTLEGAYDTEAMESIWDAAPRDSVLECGGKDSRREPHIVDTAFVRQLHTLSP